MKNRLLLFACLFFASYISTAQWQQTSGPTGGIVNCLTVMGSNLFAGTNGGIYVSTNNGTSWTSAKTGLTSVHVSAIVQKGANLFAGTTGGVYMSANQGANWSSVNTGLKDLNVMSLTVHGSNLFAGTADSGVYVSSNNGASWNTSNNGLVRGASHQLSATVLASSSTDLFVAIQAYQLYGQFVGDLYMSTDNGASWQPRNNGISDPSFYRPQALIQSGTSLFLGTENGAFLSINNGALWTKADTGLINHNVHAFAVSGSNVFAGTEQGVFLSQNNGAIWSSAGASMATKPVYALAVSGSNVFAGTGLSTNVSGGVYLSTDNGNNWNVLNTGFPDMQVNALAVSGTTLFAGTNGIGVFASSDNGASWTAKNNGLTNGKVTCLAVSGSYLFAGTAGGGIFRSGDNGNSWTAVNNGLVILGDFYIASLTVIGSNIYAGTGHTFLFSKDNGATWNMAAKYLESVRGLTVSGTNLIAVCNGGILVFPNYTINCDTCSHFKSTFFDGATVMAVASSGSKVYAAPIAEGILVSNDNGETWSFMNSGLTDLYVYSLITIGSNVFAGTGHGIYVSDNGGTSWTSMNMGINDIDVYAFTQSGSTLFAGTEISTWKNSSAVGINGSEYKNRHLLSVYPNPSDGGFTLNYNSSAKGTLLINIRDILGQLVYTENNGLFPGAYTRTLNLSEPKGIYFVEIICGKEQLTKKIILQ
jgi:ligand-binding sensor domain-containing protein